MARYKHIYLTMMTICKQNREHDIHIQLIDDALLRTLAECSVFFLAAGSIVTPRQVSKKHLNAKKCVSMVSAIIWFLDFYLTINCVLNKKFCGIDFVFIRL